MSIETNRVTMETYRDSEGNGAVMAAYLAVNGCALTVRLIDTGESGAFYLCVRGDDHRNVYILALPSARWKDDAKADGFRIIKRISFEETHATAKTHAEQEAEAAPTGKPA